MALRTDVVLVGPLLPLSKQLVLKELDCPLELFSASCLPRDDLSPSYILLPIMLSYNKALTRVQLRQDPPELRAKQTSFLYKGFSLQQWKMG